MTDTTIKHTGTVKWFGDNGRHFGFITPDAGGQDVFVHISAAGRAGMREIKQGDRLEYPIEVDKRSGKPCATNLKIIQ